MYFVFKDFHQKIYQLVSVTNSGKIKLSIETQASFNRK